MDREFILTNRLFLWVREEHLTLRSSSILIRADIILEIGGAFNKPGVVMANAIASIVDKNGKIMIEGWRNNTIKESVRKAISKLTISQDDTTPVVNPN